MSFNQRKLTKSVEQTRGIFDKFVYKTNDLISDVMKAGYFDESRYYNDTDWRGSVIECDCADGHVIISINDNSHNLLYKSTSTVQNIISVKSSSDLRPPLDSSILYVIDGVVDVSDQEIEIPTNGLNIAGLNFNVSGLVSSSDNYTMFTSPAGGSGDILINDLSITVSGSNSRVYGVNPVDANRAVEITSVNYLECTSLGTIDGYRQLLESGTGRFGGTPDLTLSGSINGVRITASIARGMEDLTSLFKAGAGLEFSGRFITDINCDLPTNGALIDFSESNILNDEALIMDGCFVTRGGVLNASDTTKYPNINHQSVKSNWGNNTGLPNTKKYIKSNCTTEVETVVTVVDTYYPLLGVKTVVDSAQFDSPENGQFRLLTGNGVYQLTGTIFVEGQAGNLIDLRVALSSDDGVTFPTEINHIQQEIPNYSGAVDFATYSLNFISELKKGDRVRLEVENKTNTQNVTQKLESFFIITEV